MELAELQNIWQEYDKKISENTRLNKEILRLILLEKPQRRLNWIKIKAGAWIFSPVLFIFLVLILNVQFNVSTKIFYRIRSVFICLHSQLFLGYQIFHLDP